MRSAGALDDGRHRGLVARGTGETRRGWRLNRNPFGIRMSTLRRRVSGRSTLPTVRVWRRASPSLSAHISCRHRPRPNPRWCRLAREGEISVGILMAEGIKSWCSPGATARSGSRPGDHPHAQLRCTFPFREEVGRLCSLHRNSRSAPSLD